jgi:hypothetical protein
MPNLSVYVVVAGLGDWLAGSLAGWLAGTLVVGGLVGLGGCWLVAACLPKAKGVPRFRRSCSHLWKIGITAAVTI